MTSNAGIQRDGASCAQIGLRYHDAGDRGGLRALLRYRKFPLAVRYRARPDDSCGHHRNGTAGEYRSRFGFAARNRLERGLRQRRAIDGPRRRYVRSQIAIRASRVVVVPRGAAANALTVVAQLGYDRRALAIQCAVSWT